MVDYKLPSDFLSVADKDIKEETEVTDIDADSQTDDLLATYEIMHNSPKTIYLLDKFQEIAIPELQSPISSIVLLNHNPKRKSTKRRTQKSKSKTKRGSKTKRKSTKRSKSIKRSSKRKSTKRRTQKSKSKAKHNSVKRKSTKRQSPKSKKK